MSNIKKDFEGQFGFLRIQKDAIRFEDIERAAIWMAERCAKEAETRDYFTYKPHACIADCIRQLAKELQA